MFKSFLYTSQYIAYMRFSQYIADARPQVYTVHVTQYISDA